MKYLISTVETYRVDLKAEAEDLINTANSVTNERDGILVKYSNATKEIKSKGEVVDTWQHVILTKVFNEEKEPYNNITINYNNNNIAINGNNEE